MIHNANLGSNMRWMVKEGEIDEEKWKNNAAAPGGILYHHGTSEKGPQVVLPLPLNSAFYTVEQEAKSDIEYYLGIQPPSMGIQQSADETYRGFLARDEYGTRRVRQWVYSMVDPALEHAGKIFYDLSRDVYAVHKIFRIVQPRAGSDEVDSIEQEINAPVYDDFGKQIGIYNNYQASQYDVRLVSGSTLPINRWAIKEEYRQLYADGIIDDIAYLMETDVKNKNSIIRRKSMIAQMQSQNTNLQEEIKQLNGDIDTLRRQIIQAGIRDEVRSAEAEMVKEKYERKAMDKVAASKFAMQLDAASKEITKAKEAKSSKNKK
jgi:hypothetical protein